MIRESLRRTQLEKLRALVEEIYPANPFYRRKLDASGFEPRALKDAKALEDVLPLLPLTAKAELQDDQASHLPYGSNLTYPLDRYVRVHRTSGTTGRPLSWLDTKESWDWFIRCWKEVYRGAGLEPRDRCFFPFSFGPFIGFWGAFEAARELGNFSLPAGGMSSAARLRYLLEHGSTFIACTPTYALHLEEVARAEGIDLAASAVRALIVAGEPGAHIEPVRRRIEAAWGARVFDHHGMTEIGCVSFEFHGSRSSLYIIEEEFIVEVLDTEKDAPVEPGAPGELVLTNLGRHGSPLLRYRTGDLVRWVEASESEAREIGIPVSGRLEGGILGRIDDMFFVRGNNVYPSAVEAVIRAFPEVAEYRLEVIESGGLTDLEVELEAFPAASAACSGGSGPLKTGKGLAERVARSIQDQLLFRARVRVVPSGTLPRFELKARRLTREKRG